MCTDTELILHTQVSPVRKHNVQTWKSNLSWDKRGVPEWGKHQIVSSSDGLTALQRPPPSHGVCVCVYMPKHSFSSFYTPGLLFFLTSTNTILLTAHSTDNIRKYSNNFTSTSLAQLMNVFFRRSGGCFYDYFSSTLYISTYTQRPCY